MSGKKKRTNDIIEEIETLGQEDEKKAVKWVQEQGKVGEEQVQEKKNKILDNLEKKKKTVYSYKDALFVELYRQMVSCYELLPMGFSWIPKRSDKGLELWIRDPHNNFYAKGMYISNNPLYDLNCIERMIDQALVYMDKLEEQQALIVAK